MLPPRGLELLSNSSHFLINDTFKQLQNKLQCPSVECIPPPRPNSIKSNQIMFPHNFEPAIAS